VSAALLIAAALAPAAARAQDKSIYEIQYATDPSGASPWAGSVVDCLGGIVTHKFPGSKPKLTLQDPNFADGWGGIQVKDWTIGALYDQVEVGDWVRLTNVYVEEYRGGTILKYHADTSPGFEILSPGNALPAPKLVGLAEIAAPVEQGNDEWYVADHGAEKYEAMWLTVRNVTITEMDLGKAGDNYALTGAAGSCWAGDYMNVDVGLDYYHPSIAIGQDFRSVSGILEQYTRLDNGWDYYQLLTTETADLVVPEPASGTILLAAACGALLTRRRRS
jgi:hypothetical protein